MSASLRLHDFRRGRHGSMARRVPATVALGVSEQREPWSMTSNRTLPSRGKARLTTRPSLPGHGSCPAPEPVQTRRARAARPPFGSSSVWINQSERKGVVVSTPEPDERVEAIRRRAYEISEGPDAGTPEENWERAVREILGESPQDEGQTAPEQS